MWENFSNKKDIFFRTRRLDWILNENKMEKNYKIYQVIWRRKLEIDILFVRYEKSRPVSQKKKLNSIFNLKKGNFQKIKIVYCVSISFKNIVTCNVIYNIFEARLKKICFWWIKNRQKGFWFGSKLMRHSSSQKSA
jgi:hypothetical protein